MSSAAAPALDFTLGVGPTFSCQSRGPGVRVAALTFLEQRLLETGAGVLTTEEV